MKHLLFLVIALVLVPASSEAAGRKQTKRHPLLPSFSKPAEPAPAGKLFSTSISGKDLRFISDAIEFGLSQVFLSSLAAKQAQTDRVKALANVLSQTQREENSKISRLAATKGVSVADREAAAQDGLTRKFAKLPPEKFDAAWIEEIVALNEKAVANYTEASAFEDVEINTFAKKALSLAKEKLALVSGAGSAGKVKFRTDMSQPQVR
jgi:predicted outer membrane protein